MLPEHDFACEPDWPVPDDAQCHELWDRYEMMPHIREHSQSVADFATALATEADIRGLLPETLTVALVRASAMLHDLAKTYTIQNGGSHAQQGASWVLRETHNPAIAHGILYHVACPWPDVEHRIFHVPLMVLYADKRVCHAEFASLEERFADLLERYGKNERSRAMLYASHEQALLIERAYSARLGCNIHACTPHCGRLVERA